MKKEVVEMEGRVVVYIKDEDGSVMLVQPFDPRTGKPFESEDVANQWADEMIALMLPAEEGNTEDTITEG